MLQGSQIHSIVPRGAKPIRNFNAANYDSLRKMGIDLNYEGNLFEIARLEKRHLNRSAMDALQPTITTAQIPNLVQFLQEWLPGFVYVLTWARKIDELVPKATVGSWEDEEVIQPILEQVASSQPYGDYTNTPLSSWNVNYNPRTVVRFEEGNRVGKLETARAARIQVDNAAVKRGSAALALEIVRNYTGFFGYDAGANSTYGFLNDPGLGSYHSLPNGFSGHPQWSTKTFLEIIADLQYMYATLRNQSQDNIDPQNSETILALPTNAIDYLNTVSDFGISVFDWIKQSYPKTRIISAPELDTATGGVGGMYLYAEKIQDMSTDGGMTFIQPVPATFMILGVAQYEKYYVESYTNATAGVMAKRPYLVVRASGLS